MGSLCVRQMQATGTLTALSDSDSVCRMSNMVFSTVPLQSKCGNLWQEKVLWYKEMSFLGNYTVHLWYLPCTGMSPPSHGTYTALSTVRWMEPGRKCSQAQPVLVLRLHILLSKEVLVFDGAPQYFSHYGTNRKQKYWNEVKQLPGPKSNNRSWADDP